MYILAVDQSTTSTKAMLFDQSARLVCRRNVDHRQIYPRVGWVEHDPMEVYDNLVAAVKLVIESSGVDKSEISCLSISNQRETTVIWDADTARSVYNAIVWQCPRGEDIVRRDAIASRRDDIAYRTGLTLSPYFSAAKAAWIVENAPVEGKRLMFGTIDSWLCFKLTGNHATDYSNASRTQLFNLHTLKWDEELIELFGLHGVSFPEIKDSNAVFGETTVGGVFERPIPLAGMLGDSHAALLAQQCFGRGMGKATFGSGTSVMMNIGACPLLSKKGLSTSVAWGLDGSVEFVYEGNINCTGDTLRWLVNEMGLLPDSKSSEAAAASVTSNAGVYLVPAFTGLGTPYFDSSARGIICGLSRDSNKNHVVRAALEAIAYQVRDVVEPMIEESGMKFEELRVDGGPSANAFLMQFISDMLGTNVVCAEIEELSALGAAFAGGLGVGVFPNRAALEALRAVKTIYSPRMPKHEADDLYSGWKLAVAKALETKKPYNITLCKTLG